MGQPFHRPASPRRPLASATATVRRATLAPRRHGAEFLAELLDFEGAVQLAQALETVPSTTTTPWSREEAVARAQLRLANAEHDARRPLHDPHSGASLVSAERIERVLERAGAPAVRSRKAIASAARELFAPVEARALQRIASVRRLVAEIREELGPVIAATGPVPARLEQLDAALTGATAAREGALLSRALGALTEAFAAELERAVLALPKPCDALPVDAWTGEDGFVHAHLARYETFAVAAFLHERARVDMLVRNTLGERLR